MYHKTFTSTNGNLSESSFSYFTDPHFDTVTVGFSKLFSYRLQNADNVAYIAVFIFYTHIDDTADVWDAVKRRVDFHTSLNVRRRLGPPYISG